MISTATRELRVRFGMLAVATHWRWFGLPDGMYDAVEAQARHSRRRHRDVADARFPPRSRPHGQGEELRLDRDRDGEGVHAISRRPARMRSAGSRRTSTRTARSATPSIGTAEKGTGNRRPPGRRLHRAAARHDTFDLSRLTACKARSACRCDAVRRHRLARRARRYWICNARVPLCAAGRPAWLLRRRIARTASAPVDLLIEDGKLRASRRRQRAGDDESARVDLHGRQLWPTLIDMHTHLDSRPHGGALAQPRRHVR